MIKINMFSCYSCFIMSTKIFQYSYPQTCQLNSEQVDIWILPLMHKNQHCLLKNILSKAEQMRAEKFYFTKHQRRFVTTHILLRLLLAKYINKQPQLLQFTYNQHGKPALINEEKLQFNISHSQETAVIAIGKTYELGIDIEFFSARNFHGVA